MVIAFFEEFLRVGVYKRNQGRIVRQVTFAAMALALLIGLWRMILLLRGYGDSCPPWLCYGLPAVLAVVGLWAAYRSVNLPAFADFLIAVEAEMNKVSWPSRGELFALVGGRDRDDFFDRPLVGGVRCLLGLVLQGNWRVLRLIGGFGHDR